MSDLQTAVRAKVEAAEIDRDPFPHVVVPDLLPEDFFRGLAGSLPPLEAFELSKNGLKANLTLDEDDEHFMAAPEGFRAAWGVLRDEVVRDTIAPVLIDRFEDEIREKYAALWSPELADELMADGLAASDGRIMARKEGYVLDPHSDAAHYAVTCLLYFATADDESSGALCLFRPERRPELRHVSTYYPEKEEGIAAELVKAIPIRENLFVSFVNGPESLHGVRIERREDASVRITYQTHIRPRHDLRKEAASLIGRLEDPAARGRWERYVEAKS
jgi:hypothetical protein